MKYADQIISFVCDDIRREVGNKRSLMGIYDDVVVESVPTLMPKICLAVSFRKVKKVFISVKSIRVTLKNPDGGKTEIPEFNPPANSKIGLNHNLDLFVIPFKIDQTGTYTWEIRFNNEEEPVFCHEFLVRTASDQKEPKK